MKNLHDQIRITVIATGFDEGRRKLQEMVQDQTMQQPTMDDNSATMGAFGTTPDEKPQEEESIFDIPAFLRQKN